MVMIHFISSLSASFISMKARFIVDINKSGGKVMYNRGMYTYKNENVDIKTRYTVEYTTDQKVFDLMDTVNFDFDMLSKKQFDYLEDAITFWNTLYYREDVLHVMLFEQVILNGEIVLEQSKDQVLPTVLDEISRKKVESNQKLREEFERENNLLKAFLQKYHVDPDKAMKEMEAAQNEDNTI